MEREKTMTKEQFTAFIKAKEGLLTEIRETAWALHASVGQTYDKSQPYGVHLSMVADAAMKFGHEVVEDEADIVPLVFAAYYHDSIEDARLTYNDVKAVARKYMDEGQTFMAAEIVYALTNDKGRTRQERAGEHYYAGIRETPYAPFVKLCDRLANMTYSFKGTNEANNHMHKVYENEWPHFKEAITVTGDDCRLMLPKAMIEEVESLFQ